MAHAAGTARRKRAAEVGRGGRGPAGHLEAFGIRTPLIRPGDELEAVLVAAIRRAGLVPRDGDVLVLAESAVATAEGRVFELARVAPSPGTVELARAWGVPPSQAQLVIDESDEVLGACEGVVLALRSNVLMPNAGLDISNAPPGCAVAVPADPDASARRVRMALEREFGCRLGVVVADSRVVPLRLGCVGVALGASGFEAVEDDRGKADLFGRKLSMTRIALADDIATAAELLMGETDARVPAVLVRGAPVTLSGRDGVPTVPPAQCLYLGVLAPRKRKASRSSPA